MGSGANSSGVKRRMRYLRHLRRVFATEVFSFLEFVLIYDGDPWSLFSCVSLPLSPKVGEESWQALFVSPISIPFLFCSSEK